MLFRSILLVCAVRAFITADAESHSASDTILSVAPLWAVCGLAWWWILRLGKGVSEEQRKKSDKNS